MPDRLIRDELLESGRWLDLPHDTERLIFIGLILICDDFGNLEGGPKRLFRFVQRFTQVKSEEASSAALLRLFEADLIRRYEVDKREFFHVMKFRAHRQYLVRKYPASPWDIPFKVGKERRVVERYFAKDQTDSENLVDTSLLSSYHVLEGVGVGVGVGVGAIKSALPRAQDAAPVDNSAGHKPKTWSEHWTAQGKSLGINPNPGESTSAYCHRVQSLAKQK